MTRSVAIIGAGVAGLGIAWRLAQSGFSVTVYDKGQAGRCASWVAAGMLAAVIEAEPGEDALLPFVLEAQRLWPSFAQELQAASGVDPLYYETGTLFVAVERDDVGLVRQRHDFLAARGLPVRWLARDELRAREPFLHPRITSGFFSPEDHQVDNRCLVEALHAACLKAGVVVHEHAPVEAVHHANGAVTGLTVKGARVDADEVILCAGAWTATIPGIPEQLLPPVFPMKGQVTCLQMDPRQPLLRHVVWTPQVYLVPRAEGYLIIGATLEDKGFDENLTAGGILHLLRETWEALPGIDELPLLESCTSFRPTSRDDAPILGASGIKGLTYATGQHRHGILMTPLIAQAVADYMRTGALPSVATPFTMQRFAA